MIITAETALKHARRTARGEQTMNIKTTETTKVTEITATADELFSSRTLSENVISALSRVFGSIGTNSGDENNEEDYETEE